jgi:hypothetical protein
MKKVAKNCLPPPKVYRGSLTAWDNANRKRVYFGKQDDPSSLRKYAEWVESLGQCTSLDSSPDGKPADTGEFSTPRRVPQKTATGPTIADLSLAFLDAKREHSHYYHYRTACKFLKSYAEMETVDFDAFYLLEVQAE